MGLLLTLPLWSNPVSAPQLLQLVDYVGVDYEEAVDKPGHIQNPAEYEEMKEFSTAILWGNSSLARYARKTRFNRSGSRTPTAGE